MTRIFRAFIKCVPESGIVGFLAPKKKGSIDHYSDHNWKNTAMSMVWCSLNSGTLPFKVHKTVQGVVFRPRSKYSGFPQPISKFTQTQVQGKNISRTVCNTT